MLLGGRIAGSLRRGATRESHTFVYESSWRTDPAAYPLSLSLPMAAQSHGGPALVRYLRGLLPDDSRRLNEIAGEFGVAPDDPFGLLAYIGEDCPGAVQFARPERLSDVEGAGPGETEWPSDAELGALLRGLAARSEAGRAAVETGRFSLPGALPKVALAWDGTGGRWGRPSGRAATTHILKPPLNGVPHHNENEHLCLDLAREVGLSAAASFVLRVEDAQAIVVERYDREARGGVVLRLHQEDVAQALGADPALRYASEGAPGIREIVGLLRDRAADHDDVHRFVRAVAFNWIIAGTDAHARNYSVLIRPGGQAALAPLYDLASALLFTKVKTKVEEMKLAMAVDGMTTIGEITRASWEAQAKAVRLDPARVVGELHDLALRIPEAARAVAERGAAAGLDERFLARFTKSVSGRALACARMLAPRR